MNPTEHPPTLQAIVGALVFAAKQPLSLAQMRKVLTDVAGEYGGAATALAHTDDAALTATLQTIAATLDSGGLGLALKEVAQGYRLENRIECGPWVRQLLDRGRPNRLSRPALETLAIIAYRQPCTRADIERVRGVAVDQVLRNLMEAQLVRIVGRSDYPGKPMLYGTTQFFLEHFGLAKVDDLPATAELRGMAARVQQAAEKAAAHRAAATDTEDSATEPEPEPEPESGPAESAEPDQPPDPPTDDAPAPEIRL